MINTPENAGDLKQAARLLLQEQMNDWDLVRLNYSQLTRTRQKMFYLKGARVAVQYNPGREKSTTAKTDDKSINERKCFLCRENRPVIQRGIECQDGLTLLVNPYPVFPEHFTIVSDEHKPQLIKENFHSFVNLVKNLSYSYALLYNGPGCGASAPDHFHFQAVRKNLLPISDDIELLKNEYGEIVFDTDEIVLTAVNDNLRRMVVIESFDENVLFHAFEKLLDMMSSTENNNEPMINLTGWFNDERGWVIVIFLREKHRSSHYFFDDERRIVLSPAAIDLSGVAITPIRKDYERITSELISEIFNEVSLNVKKFGNLKNILRENF